MVTTIAADLVAAEGRDALTVRRVAEAAGTSTTVVSHYFADMADLLHETHQLAARRSRQRLERVLADDAGDLIGVVEAVLPLDAQRRDDWRIWVAFWGDALSSRAFALEQRRRSRGLSTQISSCLKVMVDRGAVSRSLDIGTAADHLAALVHGVAVEAVFDPTRWTPAAQRDAIRAHLRAIGVDSAGRSQEADGSVRV